MKRFFKKCLISIFMILVLSNFIIGIPGIQVNTVYAADGGWNWDDILGGIVGILFWPLKLPFIIIPMGINTITSTLYNLGLVAGSPDAGDFFITPYHILFNKMEIVNINFFNLSSGHPTADAFRAAVASWYYSMRLIASMALLVILVYVGIRMALSTIASEKAMYKKMLVDWVTSLALLFLLHYIIQFVFACNEALVKGMDSLAQATNMDTFVEELLDMAFGIDLIASVIGIAVYAMLILQTLSFLIAYMKRMITVGFLIIIAPLITITYSIDKMGDGKSQALNTWLKEFVYNILIQPFHCILYLAFGKIVLDLLASGGTSDVNIATMVLAILCIQFIKDGEKIVKKIFGFQAESLGGLSESAKMATAAFGVGKKVGAAAGAAVGKGVDKLSQSKTGKAIASATKSAAKKVTGKIGETASKVGKSIAESKVGQGVGKAAKAVAKPVRNGMRSIAERSKEARERKRDEKIMQQMEKKFGGIENLEKFRNKATDKEWEQARTDAAQKVDDDDKERKEKRKKISGGVGKVAGAVGKGALRLATAPTRALLDKDKRKDTWKVIAGLSTGMIGLGDSMGTAITTGQIGYGFVDGLTSQSTKTARNEIENQVDLQNNLGVEVDPKHLAMVKTRGDGDGYDNKVIENKLQQLLDKLNELGLKNSQGAVEQLNYDLSYNPQNVNQKNIEEMLNSAGISGENKDAAMSAMMGFAQFRADAGLYRAMESGNAAGMSMNNIMNTATGANNIERIEEIRTSRAQAEQKTQKVKVTKRTVQNVEETNNVEEIIEVEEVEEVENDSRVDRARARSRRTNSADRLRRNRRNS